MLGSLAATAPSTRHTLVGSVRVFLGESLLIPTGLLTAAYLARRLGPEGYGLFAVAAALVAWIEWSLAALFSRASVKFVADVRDWRPIGSTILSVHVFVSVAAALLLWLAAPPLAAFLGTPAIAGYLRVFALDIPLFSMAQAHRNILVGLGGFTQRAWAAAARWVSRLILVVLLVELGLSINGAILGSIGASLIELVVARAFVRPAFSSRAALRVRKLLGYAAPLLLSAVAIRLFDKLDLVALMALGGRPGQAGLYAAAQNLALLPGLFTGAVSPVLLSALSRALRDGESALAGRLAQHAMRGMLLLLPFASLVAGAAPEIVRLVFGPAFFQTATLLSWLIFAAVAQVFVSVGTAILTATGRVGLTLALTGPLPLIALSGYLVLIPNWGPLGAAIVTFLCATLAAAATVLAVHRVCRALPPAATAMRCTLVCLAAFGAATLWPTQGWLVIAKLAAISLAIPAALGVLGEFSAAELSALRALGRRTAPG
jgi:O-antigen/teichoic acid export membrane protein